MQVAQNQVTRMRALLDIKHLAYQLRVQGGGTQLVYNRRRAQGDTRNVRLRSTGETPRCEIVLHRLQVNMALAPPGVRCHNSESLSMRAHLASSEDVELAFVDRPVADSPEARLVLRVKGFLLQHGLHDAKVERANTDRRNGTKLRSIGDCRRSTRLRSTGVSRTNHDCACKESRHL